MQSHDVDAAHETRLYRIPAVAERLAVSVRTVWDLIRAGRLRPTRLGPRTVRVSEAELARFARASAR